MKVKHIKVVLWCVFLLAAVLAIYFYESEEFDMVRALKEEDTHLIHRTELIPREDVTSFIVADGKLMLHYENAELVNVYSSEGEFLYGIQITDGNNGTAGVTYRDGMLYFKGRVAGIYFFSQDQRVLPEELGISKEEYTMLDRHFPHEIMHTEGDYSYYYVKEENKIIRSDGNETVNFLVFPQKNPNIIPLFYVMVCATTGLCYFDNKEKKQ